MTITDLAGYGGTVVGTCLMLPQIAKAVRTGHMADVSLLMIVLYFVNCILWLTYGIGTHAKPIEWANGIALVISIVQIVLKVALDRKMRALPR